MAQTHAGSKHGQTAPDDISDAALRAALEQVPRGALALAGTALALVLAAWMLVYFAIYLPRGMVG